MGTPNKPRHFMQQNFPLRGEQWTVFTQHSSLKMAFLAIISGLVSVIQPIDSFAQSQSVWDKPALLGDWGGNRPALADQGLEFNFVYTGEFFHNATGGLSRDTEYLGNFDATLAIDAEQWAGWTGASFYFYALGNHGGSPSEHSGDLQGISNIDAPNALKLYEAWYQQKFFGDRMSLLFGLYDLNSEFDSIDTASLFINSSHGIGPDFSQSGQNGPSILPDHIAGIALQIRACGMVLSASGRL